ncbi:MAG: MlaA family lipoprotein, partial [Pseudomonadaceae bacterium]
MLLSLLFASAAAWGETSNIDEDGFTHPLRDLEFNPGLDQREFERATFKALDVYDPFESFNR